MERSLCMKRRWVYSGLFLLLLVLGTVLAYVLPHEKEIETTLSGLQRSFSEGEDEIMDVTIRGTAKYRYFTMKEFEGEFTFSDSLHPWNGKHVLIHFYKGVGNVSLYEKENQLNSMQHGGDLSTKDFEEILILYYEEGSQPRTDEFFAAPAKNREESVALSEKLSEGTWFSEVEWDR
jgi:hypothetical protein